MKYLSNKFTDSATFSSVYATEHRFHSAVTMVLCRYFAQGTCRFGENCRFEHSRAGGGREESWNERSWDGGYDGSAPPSYNRGRGGGGTQNRYGSNSTSYNSYGSSNYDRYESSNYNPRANTRPLNQPAPTSNRFSALDTRNGGHPRQQFHQEAPNTVRLSRDQREMIQTMVQDIDSWEYGHQWPFSCFAPSKDGLNFPGFEDISPEELRWSAYVALKDGSVDTYTQSILQVQTEIKQKWALMRQHNQEVIDILVKLANEVTVIQPPSQFGSSTAKFIRSQLHNFDTKPNTFGTFADKGFGGSASQQNRSNSVFGGTSFGSQSAGANMFGSTLKAEEAAPSEVSSIETFSFKLSEKPAQTGPTSTFGNSGKTTFFGSAIPQSSSAPQTPSTVLTVTTTYTPMNELTEEEKAQFMATAFTFGKIPERPPPKELCF